MDLGQGEQAVLILLVMALSLAGHTTPLCNGMLEWNIESCSLKDQLLRPEKNMILENSVYLVQNDLLTGNPVLGPNL